MTENVRKGRMVRIVRMLSGTDPPIDEVKFVAMCAYNLGLTVKKIREYIKVLEDIGSVSYEDGNLVWHE